jgi:hypothetical protein
MIILARYTINTYSCNCASMEVKPGHSLYGKKHKFKVVENRELRRIFGPRR